MALHDDAVGTIFEKSPICTFNAAAIPVEPPAIEDVEALRLGGFEPKKPTGKILILLIKKTTICYSPIVGMCILDVIICKIYRCIKSCWIRAQV